MSLNPVFEELERHFKSSSPKNILEVGCGSGRLSFELLKRYPESSFITSDINEGVVKDLPKVAGITPVVFDATQEDISCFKGEKFGAIVSVGAVRYFKDQQHTQRLSKLLNPGGIVVLVDYEPFPDGQAVGLRNVPWLTAFYILRNHYKTDTSFQVRVDTESSNYLNVLSKLAGSRMRQTYMMVLKAPSREVQEGAAKSC